MTKLSKLIRLVNMLNGPIAVPLKRICDTCEISKRTAYRYLSHISEALIPVYYDPKQAGYRLSSYNRVKVDALTLSDLVLLTCALALSSHHLNDHYQQDFSKLVDKLRNLRELGEREMLADLALRLGGALPSKDYSDLLTNALIESAVVNQRALQVDCQLGKNVLCTTDYEHPVLHFSHEWFVSNSQAQPISNHSLDTIVKAKIS